jgi:hypothetical protein
MKPRFYQRRASAFAFCLVAIPLACGNDKRAADDDDGVGASAGRGGTVGSGGSAGKSSTPSDRCSECDDSTDCSTGFCNRIGSSDFLELIGEPLSPAGACSAPGDVGKCGCFVGYVEGGSLCVGTGCTGTAVTLCDHLSGDEFTGAVGTGGTGGTGGTSGKGGTAGVGPNGRAGGAGRGGSSGTGGNLATDSLGESCDADADCGPNLICLASDALDGSGPARGLCTKPCAADAECRALAAGAYCIGFGNDANYCVEGCLLGTLDTPKCRERPELACSVIGAIPGAVSCLDVNDCRTGQLCETTTNLCSDAVTGCVPMCGANSDCASNQYCDFATGLCVSNRPQGLPLGSLCVPPASSGDPDPCNGFCQPGTDPTEGQCTALCSFNPAFTGCGWDGTGTANMGCLFATVLSSSDVAPGDVGICGALCDCNTDCRLPGTFCVDESGGSIEDIWNRNGYCRALDAGETESDTFDDCPDGAGGSGAGGESGDG